MWNISEKLLDTPYKTYLVQPASQLVARRPKVPPATSHTFRLFSLNNIHFYIVYYNMYLNFNELF